MSEPPYLYYLKMMSGHDPNKPLSSKHRADLVSCGIKNAIGVAFIVLSAALVYVASTDAEVASNRLYIYSALIVFAIIAGAYTVLPMFQSKMDAMSALSGGIFVCIIVIGTYFFIRKTKSEDIVYWNYALMLVGILFGISLLIISYRVTIRYMMSQTGFAGFIAQLIFYLPCLITDGIQMWVNHVKAQKGKALIGLALLTGAVVGYLIYFFAGAIRNLVSKPTLPSWVPTWGSITSWIPTVSFPIGATLPTFTFSSVTDHLPKVSVPTLSSTGSDTVRLDKLSTLFSSTELSDDMTSDDDGSAQPKNYTISFWLNITAPSQGAEYTILTFASSSDSTGNVGKPRITYRGDKLRVLVSNRAGGKTYDVDVPLQTRTHYAIVYDAQRVSIYLNGELVVSEELGHNTYPSYSLGDTLTAGQVGGISGTLENVKYVPTPMNKQDIVAEYIAGGGR